MATNFLTSNIKISLESKFSQSNPNLFLKAAPAITIPKSRRFSTYKTNVTPGPGSYNTLSASSSTAVVFSKTRRNTLEKFGETPGPGYYECLKLHPGPKFSITNRLISKSPISPGPGHYETQLTDRPRSVKFTRSERKIFFLNRDEIIPGPGHYTSNSNKSGPTCTFPRARKIRLKHTYENLGPGCYDVNLKEKFKFAMSKERRKSPFDLLSKS